MHYSILLALGGILIAAGTAGAQEDVATVEGKVTYDDSPVLEGRIFFHFGDGEFVGAKIKDGNFKVTRVPTGDRRVTVEGKDVPAKYGSEKTARLACKLEAGRQLFDIVLRHSR
jgi:hypothetical protein